MITNKSIVMDILSGKMEVTKVELPKVQKSDFENTVLGKRLKGVVCTPTLKI